TDRTYRDGVEITPAEFYTKLTQVETIPTTSQPTPQDFHAVYEQLSTEVEAILSIHISEDLSGTLQSARLAAAEVEIPVEIIDSRSISMGLGYIVLAAARALRAGASLEEAVAAARNLIPRLRIYFVVDTLEYLHKGGRIGSAARWFGTMLNIKPILELKDGRVEAKERVRNKRRAYARLLDIMTEQTAEGGAIHAAVVHANAPDERDKVRAQVEERFHPVELYTADLSPVVGTHVGPGTVGVAFYTDE
ncbi:MAG TPA: DegV family protein, partial [Anaerolineae bacterium]|nr:DegV family protein [Anaerolineae bacterium]